MSVLPTDETGIPWWKHNQTLICHLPGWQKFQAQKPMAFLIPIIRWLLKLEKREYDL